MARHNSPTAILMDLPPLIMAGFPIVPKLPPEFAKCNGCTFSWSRVKIEACDTLGLSEGSKNEETEYLDCNEVSKSFVYTPSLDDIGFRLKFCAVPGQGEGRREGCLETITKVKVTAGPGSCPFEKRHKYTSNVTENGVFRIMSYNILAEMYLNRDYLTEFQYCPRYAVELEYRIPLLLKEILGYNNDILCLQEVGRELFRDDLLPSLVAFDFEGHYREKGGGTAEGTAIFYRKSKFRYLGQHDILIIDKLETDPGFADILQKTYSNEKFKDAFKRNFQTVQVLVLEPIDSPRHKLVVANTHLYYYPSASHIRLIQAVVAMRHLQDVRQIYQQQDEKSKVSLVFCGDFNVLPDSMVYEFMTKKQSRGDHTDMQTIPKDQHVPDMYFSHNQNLASACGILPYTCYTELCQDMLDYIFYDVENLEVERIIPQHDHEDVQQHTAFPSVVNPSDHIAQVCELKWKYM